MLEVAEEIGLLTDRWKLVFNARIQTGNYLAERYGDYRMMMKDGII